MSKTAPLQRFTVIAIILFASLLFLVPLNAKAATTPVCDCETVWGVNFIGDAEILSEIKTRLNGEVFCTADGPTCASYCKDLKSAHEGAPPDTGIPTLKNPPVVTCESTPDPVIPGTTTSKPTSKTIELKNPLGTSSVPELISNILDAVLGLVGAIALLMFIYGGLLWLTSGGSADKVNRGRQVMVWATIGLVIIFSSYGLVKLVFGAFSKI